MHLSLTEMVEDNFFLSSVSVWVCENHCKLKIHKLEECSFYFKYETLLRLTIDYFFLIYSFQSFCTLEQYFFPCDLLCKACLCLKDLPFY